MDRQGPGACLTTHVRAADGPDLLPPRARRAAGERLGACDGDPPDGRPPPANPRVPDRAPGRGALPPSRAGSRAPRAGPARRLRQPRSAVVQLGARAAPERHRSRFGRADGAGGRGRSGTVLPGGGRGPHAVQWRVDHGQLRDRGLPGATQGAQSLGRHPDREPRLLRDAGYPASPGSAARRSGSCRLPQRGGHRRGIRSALLAARRSDRKAFHLRAACRRGRYVGARVDPGRRRCGAYQAGGARR